MAGRFRDWFSNLHRRCILKYDTGIGLMGIVMRDKVSRGRPTLPLLEWVTR